MRELHNITHKDLDGVLCAIFIHEYCRQKDITYRYYQEVYRSVDSTFNNIFRPERHSLFPLFVLSDITMNNEPEGIEEWKNVLLIDHHPKLTPSRIQNKQVVIGGVSACRLTLEYFKKLGGQYNDKFDKLAIFGSDYDTWEHKYHMSRQLNRLYYLYNFDDFFNRFKFGLDHLNDDEKRFLVWKEKDLRAKLKACNLDPVADRVVFTVVNVDVDEIAEYLYTEMPYDYVFIWKDKFGTMSIRANKNAKIDLGKFATFWGGGGYEKAAGLPAENEKAVADIMESFLGAYNKRLK